jgi:hypothetical protein
LSYMHDTTSVIHTWVAALSDEASQPFARSTQN